MKRELKSERDQRETAADKPVSGTRRRDHDEADELASSSTAVWLKEVPETTAPLLLTRKAASDADLAEGCVVDGKYVLIKAIASGGMGEIWCAYSLERREEVALKFMAPLDDDQRGERCDREARWSAHVVHPNVIRVFDYGRLGGVPYLAMELLHGECLGERLCRKGRLDLTEVVDVTEQLCRGLSAIHAAGIVHRDITLGNAFIAETDDGERVKLIDFGLAMRRDGTDKMTTTGLVLGTPFYMSPDVLSDDPPDDVHNDLWALSVLIYRTIVGARPYRQKIPVQVDRAAGCYRFRRPSAAIGAPKAVDAFFERAFAVDPSDRFQSAEELGAALREAVPPALAGRARPPYAPMIFWVLVAIFTLVIALLTVLAGGA